MMINLTNLNYRITTVITTSPLHRRKVGSDKVVFSSGFGLREFFLGLVGESAVDARLPLRHFVLRARPAHVVEPLHLLRLDDEAPDHVLPVLPRRKGDGEIRFVVRVHEPARGADAELHGGVEREVRDEGRAFLLHLGVRVGEGDGGGGVGVGLDDDGAVELWLVRLELDLEAPSPARGFRDDEPDRGAERAERRELDAEPERRARAEGVVERRHRERAPHRGAVRVVRDEVEGEGLRARNLAEPRERHLHSLLEHVPRARRVPKHRPARGRL
mmetsp:Transcript_16901/g.55307  ORF Transcript_16901/g.55307 Transcript_16901/m.55307 type:complete len:273 (+) Transcript_16901:3-821(+)